MARYRCKNCGSSFVVDEQTIPLHKPNCPHCNSSWTEYEEAGMKLNIYKEPVFKPRYHLMFG